MQENKSYTRHQLRIAAYEYVFAYDVQRDDVFDTLEEDMLEKGIEGENAEYIRKILKYLSQNMRYIDYKIAESAKGWTFERIAKTALAAMRLCITETTIFEDVPKSVAINEAVGILKKYADKKTSAFMNGILGEIYKA